MSWRFGWEWNTSGHSAHIECTESSATRFFIIPSHRDLFVCDIYTAAICIFTSFVSSNPAIAVEDTDSGMWVLLCSRFRSSCSS